MADTMDGDELLTLIRERRPIPSEVEDGVRAIFLDLFDRAMRESWDDRESHYATRAAIEEAKARFGWAAVLAWGPLERRAYRLVSQSLAADEVEMERRRVRRQERAAAAARDSRTAPGT